MGCAIYCVEQMILDLLDWNGLSCTGCTTCVNKCEFNAISMDFDSEGFNRPKLDAEKCTECKTCEKVCPLNIPLLNRNPTPSCYAACGEEAIAQLSSSGGAFTIMAQEILKEKGIIVGAAYDENMEVQHIMVDKEEDLGKLRGPKYSASNLGNIFIDVEKALKKGKKVLFTGCPCQAAGLRSFLNKDYNNLLIVDLICGGSGSPAVFKRYLSEMSEGKGIVDVNFRDKRFGWGENNTVITFKDGTEKINYDRKDPFLKGILGDVIKSKACSNCIFSETPRQGDISIGDFWNINELFRELDSKGGVSSILINSKEGEGFFKKIKPRFPVVKPVSLSFTKQFSRLHKIRAPHPSRERFFYLFREGKFPLEKCMDYAINWKYDIGICGNWTSRDYGEGISNYALYNIIKDMDLEPLMIEKRGVSFTADIPLPVQYSENPYRPFHVEKAHKSLDEERRISTRVSAFITGPGSLWNYGLHSEEGVSSYSLDFASPWRHRIAYATSFGASMFTGDAKQTKSLETLLSKFNHISVREKSDVGILEKKFNIEAKWILDPIMLLDIRHLERLASPATAKAIGDYAFNYCITPSARMFNGLDRLAEEKGYGMVTAIGLEGRKRLIERDFEATGSEWTSWNYPYIEKCSMENWIYYMMRSRIIISDSFHAICLALLLKKNFIHIKSTMSEGGRFDETASLLNHIGLLNRSFDSVNEALLSKEHLNDIDYKKVYGTLGKEQNVSMKWLKDALFKDGMLIPDSKVYPV